MSLDCIFPGETTWQIVLEADRQNIPVVLMTGDADQMKDITGGPRPFILKPFALHDLRSVIERSPAWAQEWPVDLIYTDFCSSCRQT